MNADRQNEIERICHEALARDAAERDAFIAKVCEGDEVLRREVESLLAHDETAEGFLRTPALNVAARDLAIDVDRAQPGSGVRPLQTPGAHRSPDKVNRPTLHKGPTNIPPPRPPWWIHLCAASVLGYFMLVMFSNYYPPENLGFAAAAGPDGPIVRRVRPNSEADRAGLQPGDRVVAVDGVAFEAKVFSMRARWMMATTIGEERIWLFERSGRRWFFTGGPRRRDFSIEPINLPAQAGLLVSLVFSFVVIYSRPHDRVARLGALALASIACVSAPVWPRGLPGTWRHLPVLVGALLWPACLSSVAIAPIMFSLLAVFPRSVIHRRSIWIAALLPGAIVTAWAGYYLMLVVYQPERALGVHLPDWFTVAGPLSAPAYFAAGMVALALNYRQLTDSNERRRVRLILFGMTAAGVGLLYAAVNTITGELGLWPGSSASTRPDLVIAALLFVALPLSFAYAILRQRLFDIRFIIRQGLQYGLARRSILWLMPALALALALDLLIHSAQPLIEVLRSRLWAYATLAGLAVVIYRYRDQWMTSLDRRFFREQYDAHRVLRQVVEDVRTAARLGSVAPIVVSRMSAAFHCTFIALMVREPHQRDFHAVATAPDKSVIPRLTGESTLVGLLRVLGKPIDFSNRPGWLDDELPAEDAAAIRAARIELVAPIVVAGADQCEALLVLGAKQSEEPYSRDDRELVTSVAASLALLLERPTAGPRGDAFAECQHCGKCYEADATQCADDGTPLVRVSVPRVLGGRYSIHRRLGRGGMGTVYEARDDALERRVAIKVIRDDLIGSLDAADRFRREALVAASFAHPNVVTVHDFGITDNTRAYLVMELLEGSTLRDTLRRDTRLTSPRALRIMRGVCHALDAAHRRQLVHRDLKPDNIFLTEDAGEETAKVLDFGIAKFILPALDSTARTATGVVVGTFRYMSPEQLRGGAPNPSWDLWALAVVAYEMLAGVHPFPETSALERLAALAAGIWIPLIDRQPELARSLDSLFARSFSVDPAERPASALIFMQGLEQGLHG
jgi:tRNA A-37 threonylcarbamoyl transferase component Bud32